MKAYVIAQGGAPEVLELKEIPNPTPEAGKVLIDIKGFGLNRAEAVTRMGGSGDAVKFPKVIGIECVGVVEVCPGGELEVGQTVAAAMGGMGRKYNGSYAEKTLVPVSNVFPLETSLDWTTLASIPETYFTAWGCCFETLQLTGKPRVVIRPGASALGIAITQIVNFMGGEVIGITRSAHKEEKLLNAGMKKVIVSDEPVAEQVRAIWKEGATGIVDTVVSEMTLKDDFEMKAEGAKLCLAGSLAESYATEKSVDFMQAIQHPDTSFFSSEELHVDKDGENLQTIVSRVENGDYQPHIDSIYEFEELVKAHEAMDKNAFAGKVVIKL